MNHFELTESGKKAVHNYLEEMKAKRKEILDAGKDTADDTNLPTEEEIFEDLMSFGFDEDGEVYKSFEVTDNYETDQPLLLTRGKDVIEKIDPYRGQSIIPLYANKWCCVEIAGHPEQNVYTYGNIYDDYNDLVKDHPHEDVLYGYGLKDGDRQWSDTIDQVKGCINRWFIETENASKNCRLWASIGDSKTQRGVTMVSKAYKVYGEDGHRQRMSFGPSVRWDWSNEYDGTRIFEAVNSDITKTNEYSMIRITRDKESQCEDEMSGQVSDGYFENSRVGKIVEIDPQEVTDLKERRLQELLGELEDIPMDPETERIEAPFMGFNAGAYKEDIWHWFEEVFEVRIADLLYPEDKEV